MEDIRLKKLLSISRPKHFIAGESICTEGEPGDEMYLVLQGLVDIYISSMLQGDIRVAQVESGGFFGEMAIFGQKPRSASCVARENTMCIGIKRDMLNRLIVSCPDIAEKMLEVLSNRVREMNEEIYKARPDAKAADTISFSIPKGHKSYDMEEKSNPKYLSPIYVKCPVCQEQIRVHNIRNLELTTFRTLKNQRRIYQDFDALWHYIRVCPECGYSNYYIDFFNLPDVTKDRIKEVVLEEKRYMSEYKGLKTPFDRAIANYYRALHFNLCLNGRDRKLLAKLWIYLYWLYSDADNAEMAKYCRDKSLEYYCAVYNGDLTYLDTEFSKQQCALIIGELYYENKEYEKAGRYYHEVMNYANPELSESAQNRIMELRALQDSTLG